MQERNSEKKGALAAGLVSAGLAIAAAVLTYFGVELPEGAWDAIGAAILGIAGVSGAYTLSRPGKHRAAAQLEAVRLEAERMDRSDPPSASTP